jgi:hypothetical protein
MVQKVARKCDSELEMLASYFVSLAQILATAMGGGEHAGGKARLGLPQT